MKGKAGKAEGTASENTDGISQRLRREFLDAARALVGKRQAGGWQETT